MKHWVQTSVCLLVALQLVGGHWGALQMVAWAKMLHEYSRDRGLVVAVKETFDGEHPCPMCLKIKEGRKDEGKKQPASQNQAEKMTTWLTAPVTMEIPDAGWSAQQLPAGFAMRPLSPAQWASMPPTPPPRCGAVDFVA